MSFNEMTSEQKVHDLAFLLDCFQSSENRGRGCHAVRSIVAYLYRGDITSASSVRRIEGDKTRVHTNVELLLEMIFGCRIHLEHDCKTWICARTSPKNRELERVHHD